MGSFNVRADQQKNRLYVTYAGFFSDDETKQACTAVLTGAAKLTNGFAIVTDISEFKTATTGGAEEIKRIQGVLGSMGVSKVVRVTGSQVLPTMQLSRTAREAGYGPGAEALIAETLEEAEALLDG